MEQTPNKAVILLSGGLDSTTVLAYALDQGYDCYTISFDYGQKQRHELVAAQIISSQSAASGHRVITMDFGSMGGSALTDDAIAVPESETEGIPVTYVPARNTVFLAMALGWAEVIEARDLFIGVSAVDFSGYPDCRPEFIAAFESLANVATKAGVEGKKISVNAPLQHLSKAETVELGLALGVDYSKTVSCYQATPEGLACGLCDSCRLRREGFLSAGQQDPTKYLASI
jgi:7-cyano-7-deazaguanine synthase